MLVGSFNGQKYSELPQDKELQVKIRYNTTPVPCRYVGMVGELHQIEFNRPVSAVTPGQSAVFYEGEDVVGGALIVK
jgi:tRNA-specific 2-thiouridylase